MKANDIFRCRRIALNWTKEELANRAGIPVQYIDWFERGEKIGRDFEYKIKNTIREYHRNLSPADHRKARIIELAYMIAEEENSDYLMKNIGHMQVELGFLQMYAIEGKPDYKEYWED